jgi:hypothetical protein
MTEESICTQQKCASKEVTHFQRMQPNAQLEFAHTIIQDISAKTYRQKAQLGEPGTQYK